MLRGLGLARRCHVDYLADRIGQLELEVMQLRESAAAARVRAQNESAANARTLRLHDAHLAAARLELDFRVARWRECAARLPAVAGDPDHGFAPAPTGPLQSAHDRPVHEKQLFSRPLISGLTARQAFFLEASCLIRLQEHGEGARHFPAPVALDPVGHRITMTRQGTSLDLLDPPQRAERAALIRGDHRDQLRLIVETLERARVVHLDMHPNGRNIAVCEAGTISLIDFDMATIDGHAFSGEIARRHADWSQNGGYERTLRQLTGIVSDFIASARPAA